MTKYARSELHRRYIAGVFGRGFATHLRMLNAVTLLIATFMMLVGESSFGASPTKLVYLLSESRTMNVYVAASGDAKNPTVTVSAELIDAKTAQKIDLDAMTVLAGIELPKADRIEGRLPEGVALESISNLSRNFFEEGMFVLRVPTPHGPHVAVVYPIDETLNLNKELSFRVLEPKSRGGTTARRFTFALAEGALKAGRASYSLLASIADSNGDGKTYSYGTVAVDVANGIYQVSKDLMNLTDFKHGLKIVRGEIPLEEPTKFGQTQERRFELMYGSDKLAQLHSYSGTLWPNWAKPMEVKEFTFVTPRRFRERQTQRIEAAMDSREGNVQSNAEFVTKLLAAPEIAGELRARGGIVLHSEINVFATVGSANYYALVKVAYAKSKSKRLDPKQISWIVKISHDRESIVGTQQLSSFAAANLETIFPGDLMLMKRGKIVKLEFQSGDPVVSCEALFR